MTVSESAETIEAKAATCRIEREQKDWLLFTFAGRLDACSVAVLWHPVLQMLQKRRPGKVTVKGEEIEYCDSAGISLLLEFECLQQQADGDIEIVGLRPEYRQMLDRVSVPEAAQLQPPTAYPRRSCLVAGRCAWVVMHDTCLLMAYVGRLTMTLLRGLSRPRQVRWKDVMYVCELAGADALPIVALISFLMGLIMAFQAAVPMKQFGAEIFVGDLVALAMVRELGGLMTAILLAGRSGSAFAAEIGTMKVNEELDALNVMAIDPMRFLVLPRVLAGVLMTPLLTMFAIVIGIVGGSFVLLAMGYPLVTYVTQVLGAIGVTDLFTGLSKSFVFGVLVAAVGCFRGLHTGTGASAVGQSATSAVVSGVVLIVVADGVFSVIFYALGI